MCTPLAWECIRPVDPPTNEWGEGMEGRLNLGGADLMRVSITSLWPILLALCSAEAWRRRAHQRSILNFYQGAM